MPSRKIMILLVVGLIVLMVAVAAAWWRFFMSANPPLPTQQVIVSGENMQLPTEQLAMDKATFTVEMAQTMVQQSNGLSFRPSLAPDAGMLFIFGRGGIQSFWMKDMKFPLDIIWISGNKIAGFAENAPAPQPGAALWSLPVYSSPDNTDKVLEVDAGTVAKYNIKVGDTITINQ